MFRAPLGSLVHAGVSNFNVCLPSEMMIWPAGSFRRSECFLARQVTSQPRHRDRTRMCKLGPKRWLDHLRSEWTSFGGRDHRRRFLLQADQVVMTLRRFAGQKRRQPHRERSQRTDCLIFANDPDQDNLKAIMATFSLRLPSHVGARFPWLQLSFSQATSALRSRRGGSDVLVWCDREKTNEKPRPQTFGI